MHRPILAAILALSLTALPATAQVEEPAPPPASPGFRPWDYLGQADAQAVLRADPSDPNGLDRDADGIACETNRAPRDTVPVAR